MLDVISILLGAIGVLQNVRNQMSLREKVDELKRGSREVGRVHEFLSEAKDFHDDFERLANVVIQPLCSDIKRDRADMQAIEQHLRKFFDFEKVVVTHRKTKHEAKTNDNSSDISPIKDRVENLCEIYPEFRSSVDSYSRGLEELKLLLGARNFGNKLDLSLDHMRDQTSRIVISADQIILNTVPIVKFLHYETTKSIESLI